VVDKIPTPKDACPIIAEQKFVSKDKQAGGLSPDGQVLSSYWYLEFSGGSFTWRHEDVVETGAYSCNQGKLSARLGAASLSGSYYTESGTLLWDSLYYNRDTAGEGSFCGGFAGVECPPGYSCVMAGSYPDAGGSCVKE
jgi:hypothetical protein